MSINLSSTDIEVNTSNKNKVIAEMVLLDITKTLQ